jgi:heme/copper-type cytochrome/quinol oxidase subunit 2
LKFDYSIFNKRFPNYGVAGFSIFFLVLLSLSFIALLALAVCDKCDLSSNSPLIITLSIMIYLPSIGILIYSLVTFAEVNKNKKLEELKSIESDEFINNFINEFVSKCQESTLIICSIIIISVSVLLFLIAIIIHKILVNREKDTYRYAAKTSQNNVN